MKAKKKPIGPGYLIDEELIRPEEVYSFHAAMTITERVFNITDAIQGDVIFKIRMPLDE